MTELTVGVRELKTNLSKYLREVKLGRSIVITEHGRAVGRLMPANLSRADKLEALQQAGILRWNGKKLPRAKPVAAWRGSISIADLISEDRE